ncbi:MAG: hypothetical protein ACRD4R_03375 [Candidatus Acidiferrales bacterium]
MDEEKFDSLIHGGPFTTSDAALADAQLRRRAMLGAALWGIGLEDLKQRLLEPSPEIPSGFDLEDFRELQRSMQTISEAYRIAPQHPWLAGLPYFSQIIFVGTQRFTVWEARCEIVRHAIEYLEHG